LILSLVSLSLRLSRLTLAENYQSLDYDSNYMLQLQ